MIKKTKSNKLNRLDLFNDNIQNILLFILVIVIVYFISRWCRSKEKFDDSTGTDEQSDYDNINNNENTIILGSSDYEKSYLNLNMHNYNNCNKLNYNNFKITNDNQKLDPIFKNVIFKKISGENQKFNIEFEFLNKDVKNKFLGSGNASVKYTFLKKNVTDEQNILNPEYLDTAVNEELKFTVKCDLTIESLDTATGYSFYNHTRILRLVGFNLTDTVNKKYLALYLNLNNIINNFSSNQSETIINLPYNYSTYIYDNLGSKLENYETINNRIYNINNNNFFKEHGNYYLNLDNNELVKQVNYYTENDFYSNDYNCYDKESDIIKYVPDNPIKKYFFESVKFDLSTNNLIIKFKSGTFQLFRLNSNRKNIIYKIIKTKNNDKKLVYKHEIAINDSYECVINLTDFLSTKFNSDIPYSTNYYQGDFNIELVTYFTWKRKDSANSNVLDNNVKINIIKFNLWQIMDAYRQKMTSINSASTNPTVTNSASTNPTFTNPTTTQSPTTTLVSGIGDTATTQFQKNEDEKIGVKGISDEDIENYEKVCQSFKTIKEKCDLNKNKNIKCDSFKEDGECYKLLNKHLQDFNNENHNCNTKNPFKVKGKIEYKTLSLQHLDNALKKKGCNYKIDKSKFQVESKTTTPQLTKQEEKELDTIVKSLDKGLELTIDELISSDKNMNIVGYDGILNIFSPNIN